MFKFNDVNWNEAVKESIRRADLAKIKYETNSCWARNFAKADESQGIYSCDELMSSDLGLCEEHHREITGRDSE